MEFIKANNIHEQEKDKIIKLANDIFYNEDKETITWNDAGRDIVFQYNNQDKQWDFVSQTNHGDPDDGYMLKKRQINDYRKFAIKLYNEYAAKKAAPNKGAQAKQVEELERYYGSHKKYYYGPEPEKDDLIGEVA